MKRHIELNDKSSSFTGNATYYYGDAAWADKNQNIKNAFLDISDCTHTIRLHPDTKKFDNNEMKKFKDKLRKLNCFIEEFLHKLPDEIDTENIAGVTKEKEYRTVTTIDGGTQRLPKEEAEKLYRQRRALGEKADIKKDVKNG